MRSSFAAGSLTVSLLLLAGCASQDASPSVEPEPTSSSDSQETKPQDGFTIDHIKSCGDVAVVVAPYIDNLVPYEGNTVNEWGANCDWETAEGDYDIANARSVSVGLTPVEAGAEVPDLGLVVQMEGCSAISDSWVESNGGVAYTCTPETAVAGVTVTTVWLPGVEISTGGAQVAGYPALDAAAALEVAKRLVNKAR